MKINRLQINNFNVLKDNFSIDFTESSNLSVLIGKNGSGKSSVLEAVGLIFKSLYKATKPTISFVLDYELYGNKIGVQYNGDFIIRVNATLYQKRDLKYLKEMGIKILPDNIIAYYSGSNIRLKKIFNFGKYTESPFLYVEDNHFKFILLSLISSNLDRHRDFLQNNFYIQRDENFSFKLKIKLFNKKLIDDIQAIDNNFKPTLINSLDVTDLLTMTRDILNSSNHKNIENIFKQLESIEKNIFESELLRICQTKAYRFVNNMFEFSFDENEIQGVIYELGSEIDLFKNLINLSAKSILKNSNISFIKDGVFVNQDTLSEGEKQLITVIGLKELVSGEENLFLLDEPDTYLHPSWQNILIESLSDTDVNDKILMTTHSAKLLGYIENNNMFILENGQWLQEHKNVYGRDINWITEYVMGDSPRKIDIIEKIENTYTLLDEEQYDKAEEFINILEDLLGPNDKDLDRLKTILDFSKD